MRIAIGITVVGSRVLLDFIITKKFVQKSGGGQVSGFGSPKAGHKHLRYCSGKHLEIAYSYGLQFGDSPRFTIPKD